VVLLSGNRWTIAIRELSSVNHSVAFELVDAEPSSLVSSLIHVIALKRAGEGTFIEWTTHLSSDITPAVAVDSSFKRLDAFADLTAYLRRNTFASGTSNNDTTVAKEFNRVVFYGRTMVEYENMHHFNFGSLDSSTKILDCPGGPSSFQSEVRAQYNLSVTSVDPMYATPESELTSIGRRDIGITIAKVRADPAKFPGAVGHLEEMEHKRHEALDRFLNDFHLRRGISYIAASLPVLPFEDGAFDISFSSFLLFIYSPISDGGIMDNNMFDLDWHRRAINELLRVTTKEVRLFPCHAYGAIDPDNEANCFAAHDDDSSTMKLIEIHPYARALFAELSGDGKHECKYFRGKYSTTSGELGLIITKKY
jgi:hypothetical protein